MFFNIETADLKIIILSRIKFSDEEICGLGVSGHPSASMVIDDIYGPYRGFRCIRDQRLDWNAMRSPVAYEMCPPTGSFDVGCQRCTVTVRS